MRQSNAMASQRKPVIVRKFSRDWCAGYAGVNFGQDSAELEILDLGGKVLWIAWKQVKWVCYVRDFPAGETVNPEQDAAPSGSPCGPEPRASGCGWL